MDRLCFLKISKRDPMTIANFSRTAKDLISLDLRRQTLEKSLKVSAFFFRGGCFFFEGNRGEIKRFVSDSIKSNLRAIHCQMALFMLFVFVFVLNILPGVKDSKFTALGLFSTSVEIKINRFANSAQQLKMRVHAKIKQFTSSE